MSVSAMHFSCSWTNGGWQIVQNCRTAELQTTDYAYPLPLDERWMGIFESKTVERRMQKSGLLSLPVPELSWWMEMYARHSSHPSRSYLIAAVAGRCEQLNAECRFRVCALFCLCRHILAAGRTVDVNSVAGLQTTDCAYLSLPCISLQPDERWMGIF